MKKKLISRRGETILELLASILIVTLLFASLCTATMIAARINNRIDDTNQGFRYEDVSLVGAKHITISDTKGINSDEILADDPQVNVFSAMKKDAADSHSDPKFWYFERK